MPVPSEVSLESTVTSFDQTITRSTPFSFTYSTSALETDIESTSSSITENTLSMISTPWITESFDVKTFELTDATDISSAFLTWEYSVESLLSSTTLQPVSLSSWGVASPPVRSEGGETVTLLSGGRSSAASRSRSLRPLHEAAARASDTVSSWTMETYTSSGWISDSKVVRVKYPWSPSTVLSGTEVYPSTLHSLSSRKGSRATLATSLTDSWGPERGHVAPVNYIGLAAKPRPLLRDWAPGLIDGILMGDAKSAILAM